MIIGIGTDIVSISRIERLLSIYKEKFINRILSKNEIESFIKKKDSQKSKYIAKRFAGKEAFAKACGLGIGRPINFNDIEITNDIFGKPILSLNVNLSILDNASIHVSLSDDTCYSIAFVTISSNEIVLS
jgi:holo-[acyl-carrier protein] synthase